MSEKRMEDYRNAPSGVGPLASEWEDKPHRLLYDLVNKITLLQSRVKGLEEALRKLGPDSSLERSAMQRVAWEALSLQGGEESRDLAVAREAILADTLKDCAHKFREYEAIHKGKGTPEAKRSASLVSPKDQQAMLNRTDLWIISMLLVIIMFDYLLFGYGR